MSRAVDRAGVWLYDVERKRIRCLDLYEHSQGRHSDGIEMVVDGVPTYFQTLNEARTIAAACSIVLTKFASGGARASMQ